MLGLLHLELYIFVHILKQRLHLAPSSNEYFIDFICLFVQFLINWYCVFLFIYVCEFYRNLSSDSPIVHILSASCAGFAASTATNPIWFVKTRLQLDHDSKTEMTVTECVKKIYRTSGFIGFYKGITASYFGISETVIHFVIYEAIKAKIVSLIE